MARVVRVAATQFSCTSDRARNRARAEAMVREAVGKGANIGTLWVRCCCCKRWRPRVAVLTACTTTPAARVSARCLPVLLQELFESLYFCQDQLADNFALATPFEGNPLLASMADLARELKVVRGHARRCLQPHFCVHVHVHVHLRLCLRLRPHICA
jgi:N-carbamoylputrescine amidase